MSTEELNVENREGKNNEPCDVEEGSDSGNSGHLESVGQTVATRSSSVASSPENKAENSDQIEETPASSSAHDGPSRIAWESGAIPTLSQPIVTLKLLLSNNMAGSVIGRSGQTVKELQTKSSSKIRLGQSGDYFPGSSDRVCLIHGPLDNVKSAIALVLEKLYNLQLELIDNQLGQGDHTNESSSATEENENKKFRINFTMKILIPTAACGMLIGKEGSTIKKLKEKAGCSSVRLSPVQVEQNATRTFERVLTVSSYDLESCTAFVGSIVDGFVRHPDICRYINGTTSYSSSRNHMNYGSHRNNAHGISNYPNQRAHASTIPLAIDSSNIPVGYDSPSSSGHLRPANYLSPARSSMDSQQSHHPASSSTPPPSFTSTINLAVPDEMIGALLGRRGQTLIDLQTESGTRIRVSQRNSFVPGTRNRIVTITGSQENIARARQLIRQVLSRTP